MEPIPSRVRRALVGRLGTIGADGPHLVPITFAAIDNRLYTAVDQKPKRTRALRRLENIGRNPSVSLLVDHYEPDWSRLWWTRLDGEATVIESGAEFDTAIEALQTKYEQYRSAPPLGPVIRIDVTRVSGWDASPQV